MVISEFWIEPWIWTNVVFQNYGLNHKVKVYIWQIWTGLNYKSKLYTQTTKVNSGTTNLTGVLIIVYMQMPKNQHYFLARAFVRSRECFVTFYFRVHAQNNAAAWGATWSGWIAL